MILPVCPESIKQAADVIRRGGIAAFPTETVYGLGADAYNADALVKIFEAKGRPRFDPLIIHIAALETLEDVADLSSLKAETRKKLFLLTENFWPGPLSIALPKSDKIPSIATAGLDTAAVRLPALNTARDLISLSTGAIAAPSANSFGSLSPTRAEHVFAGLGDKVDIILDGGPTQVGVESTVIDFTRGIIKILRHGGVPKEAIESVAGPVIDDGNRVEINSTDALVSPGRLKSHYAPRTPLFLFEKENIAAVPFELNAAYIFFDDSSRDAWLKTRGEKQNAVVRTLSSAGQIAEAAARLFETLHELDFLNLKKIFAQFAPREGLGAAINDRLERASFSNARKN